MNLHLLQDEKFYQSAINQFEYYDPGNNVYVIENSSVTNNANLDPKLEVYDFHSREAIDLIANKYSGVEKLFVHALNRPKSKIVKKIKKINPQVKVYWIFFGIDLYRELELFKGYQLFDDLKDLPKKKLSVRFVEEKLYGYFRKLIYKIDARWDYFGYFISVCDYFCFWDKYDYELLRNNFRTDAKFKYFIYHKPEQTVEFEESLLNRNIRRNTILIGNSCNLTGNHFTLLRKLKEMDVNETINFILPMSYGNAEFKKKIVEYLEKNFKGRYLVLDKLMPYDKYVELLSSIPVAIFGNRRQEAAGNIFMMLRLGAKVFLRDDNNMLRVFKDRDCRVFSFDQECNELADVTTPLSFETQKQNIINHSKYAEKEFRENFMKELLA